MSADSRLRVAVLISGSGTNLQAIIDAVAAGQLNIELIGVISDRPDAFGLQRAADAGVPVIAVDYMACADRSDYDRQLDAALAALEPNLVVLAGYMRILADATVNKYSGRMLNVHPSLLPDYPGLNTYARVLAAGDQWHGTTVHFVIPELDAGPAIIQYRVAVGPGESEASLRGRVQQGEYQIYPRAIGWFADKRLQLDDATVALDGESLTEPVVVSEE